MRGQSAAQFQCTVRYVLHHVAVALPGPGPQPRDTEGEESAAPALGTLRLSDFFRRWLFAVRGRVWPLALSRCPMCCSPCCYAYYLVACSQGLRVALALSRYQCAAGECWMPAAQCHVADVLQPNVLCPLRVSAPAFCVNNCIGTATHARGLECPIYDAICMGATHHGFRLILLGPYSKRYMELRRLLATTHEAYIIILQLPAHAACFRQVCARC